MPAFPPGNKQNKQTLPANLQLVKEACSTMYCKAGLVLFSNKTTPCSRVLLEKVTVLQLVKKFPAFN